MRGFSDLVRGFFILLIRIYQKILSRIYIPGLLFTKDRPCCRFYPTCSQYAIDAISKYGVIKGGVMAGKRLLRCNPFNPGGYDPVK